MRYLIVDLEATCWKKIPDRSRMEIIEIGAVMLASAAGPVVDEFDAFVQPVVEPYLSEFCQRLTTIQQSDVDDAELFSVVFPQFLNWIGPAPFSFCSWGGFDQTQFRRDCQRHDISFPTTFETHLNLKHLFAHCYGARGFGLRRALQKLNIPLEGQHHRGIDDARNIAKIAQRLLPEIAWTTP